MGRNRIILHVYLRRNAIDVYKRQALTKTIQKALRNYARRYQGVQLRNKVIAYCLQKGFRHEDVIAKIEEMEWQDE